MAFLTKFFGSNTKKLAPDIQFGRYSDGGKSDEQYKLWDKALSLFDTEKYLDAYASFLEFLKNNDQNNLEYTLDSGVIKFKLLQGSKIINGIADHHKFMARAPIIKMKEPNLGLMRFLLQENYNFKYSKYAVDQSGEISLGFDTYVEDGSPHKIYNALKELATEADRKDDVLMVQFEGLDSVNFFHMRHILDDEKRIKYNLFASKLDSILHEIDHGKLNTFLYPGGCSYLLLDTLYTIDYLIKPEGMTMDIINECHDIYFKTNAISVHDKNKEIIKRVRKLAQINLDALSKELYEVVATFGTVIPEGHQRLISIIDAQMNDFDWYASNGYEQYAKAICGYIFGYTMYAFMLPPPARTLIHLYYRITESDYFTQLGFDDQFQIDGAFNKKAIISAIKEVLEDPKITQKVSVDTKILNFDDSCSFCKSYLYMVRNLIYAS